MANTMNYARAYLEMLDGVYKEGAKTAILEANSDKYRQGSMGAKSLYIKKMTADGLGTYGRSAGYVDGDITIDWEAKTFSQDRGRRYKLDTMDAVEAKLQAGEMANEIQRVQINPEIDMYRFEKMYDAAYANAAYVEATLTEDTAVESIDTGIAAMDDAEVPQDDRILFVSNTTYKLMKASGEYFNVRLGNVDSSVLNRNITTFDDMPLVKVPKSRFNTNFTFNDGTTGGQTAGGAVATGKEINFMIVSLSAIVALVKHVSPKLIAPEINGFNDGWLFAYRMYHDLFVLDNKVNGIYVHTKSA